MAKTKVLKSPYQRLECAKTCVSKMAKNIEKKMARKKMNFEFLSA